MVESGNPSRLKILVVHEVNYRDKVIYEIHEFPELLAEAGHEVEFLEFAEGYKGRPGRNARTWVQTGRVYKNAKLRIYSPWLSGIAGVDRLVGFLSVFPVLWSIRKSDFDVILNYAVPTYGLQILLFGWLTNTPVVHRSLDVSHKIRKSLWNPAIALVERFVLNSATMISANNSAMADYVREKLWHKIPLSVTLPPSLSPGMEPVKFDNELALNLGIAEDDFVIAYLGSFFYFSGLDEVLREFALLQASNPRLKLLLIGGGEQERRLRNICADLNLEGSVVFTGFVPFEAIPSYMSLADVGINPMEVSSVSTFALPNKVIQYLALGLPVVSTELLGLKSALSSVTRVRWVSSPSQVVSESISLASTRTNFLERKALTGFEPRVALKSLEACLFAVVK